MQPHGTYNQRRHTLPNCDLSKLDDLIFVNASFKCAKLMHLIKSHFNHQGPVSLTTLVTGGTEGIYPSLKCIKLAILDIIKSTAAKLAPANPHLLCNLYSGPF